MTETHDGPGAANTGADDNHLSSWAAGRCEDTAPARDFGAALRRRRAAARRCVPLDDGHADPHRDRASPVPTPREVESWRAAWSHLQALGYRVDVPETVAAAGRSGSCEAAR